MIFPTLLYDVPFQGGILFIFSYILKSFGRVCSLNHPFPSFMCTNIFPSIIRIIKPSPNSLHTFIIMNKSKYQYHYVSNSLHHPYTQSEYLYLQNLSVHNNHQKDFPTDREVPPLCLFLITGEERRRKMRKMRKMSRCFTWFLISG